MLLGCGLCKSQNVVVFPSDATGTALSSSQKAALESLASKGGVVVHFFSSSDTTPTTGGGYAESRQKPMIGDDHEDFPFAIVCPKTIQEVSKTMKCCSDNGIRDISVYCGGHSTQGMKGSVVIKLSALNQVSVQQQQQQGIIKQQQPPIVTFGGGCTNAQVDGACKPYGVAITAGNATSVGAVGAMLGGGVGYLARWQGLTIDNLIEATVVLANGEIVVASKDNEHSDLLFALKGGGGNFGVVVEVKVKAGVLDFDPSLYKKGELYFETRIVRHGGGDGSSSFKFFGNGMGTSENVFRAWRDYALRAPNHVSVDCVLPTGGPMVQMFTYKGGHKEAIAESKNEWSLLGKPMVKIGKPQNYFDAVQTASSKQIDSLYPCPHCFRVAIMDSLPEKAIKILMNACTKGRPNKNSLIHVERLGGKIDTPDDGTEASAFAHRGGQFWISMIGMYSVKGKKSTPEEDAKVDDWIDNLYNDLKPYAIGKTCTGTMGYYDKRTKTVLNENAFGEMGYNRIGDKKTRNRVARIMAAKKKYDPNNFFQHVENGFSNARNIDPTKELGSNSLSQGQPLESAL